MPCLLPALRLALVTVAAGLAAFFSTRGFVSKHVQTRPDSRVAPCGASAQNTAIPGNSKDAREASAAPPPAVSELSAAGKEKDFFRAAAMVFDAVERMSAADFAWYVSARALPPDFAGPEESNEDPALLRFKNAFPEAFVARWLAVDPEGAVGAMMALARKDKNGIAPAGARALGEALARARPVAYLAAESEFSDAEWPWRVAFSTLAKTSLEAARHRAAELPAHRREAAAQAIALGLAEVDPVAAVCYAWPTDGKVAEAAMRSAERAGLGVVRQVLQAGHADLELRADLESLYARHPELAQDAPLSAQRIDPGERDFRDIARRLPVEEIQKRLAVAQKDPDGMQVLLRSQLAEAWAARDPNAAAAWALERYATAPAATEILAAQKVFAVWREKDWPAAMAHWESLPASELKTTVGNQAAMTLLQRGDLEGALGIYHPRQGTPDETPTARADSEREQATFAYVAYEASRADPARAAEWLLAQPAAIDTTDELRRAFAEWTVRNADEAAEWIEQLSDGAPRDAAMAAFAAALAPGDAELAGEWIDAIADPAKRFDTARAIFAALVEADPPGARAWLRAHAGGAAEEIERVIRLAR